jgi:hypothetical protein
MVQQEVADRLVAPPGSRTYGAPSAKLAWYADARQAGSISRTVFWPAPNVDSGLVALARREPPSGGADRAATFTVIDAAFSQRRKTLPRRARRLGGVRTGGGGGDPRRGRRPRTARRGARRRGVRRDRAAPPRLSLTVTMLRRAGASEPGA